MWVERIEADVRGAQQAALLAVALGGKPEWPDLDASLTRFDELLVSEPLKVDTEELQLRAALGLRGPGGR